MVITRTKNVTICKDNAGQRIDNFLHYHCKGVPKSRIYRALRKGEVRINKKRASPTYRLKLEDRVRIPPFYQQEEKSYLDKNIKNSYRYLLETTIYEDSDWLVINKPSGVAVHGGSNIRVGLIKILKLLRTDLSFLQLAHRLDRETSGILLLAKQRHALITIQQLIREKKVEKKYLLLVKGSWLGGKRVVNLPLQKRTFSKGEHKVKIDQEGKTAITIFKPLIRFKQVSLLEAKILTGRTHQIRIHAAALNHPIAGDKKYGGRQFNCCMKKRGLNRLFLHSSQLSFKITGKTYTFKAELPQNLHSLLKELKKSVQT